jgi:Raf kinase inhibitor-like YbhB/YbcL family protein
VRRRATPAAVVLLAVAPLLVAACDTGDGKTLRPPTAPLPTTTTTTTAPFQLPQADAAATAATGPTLPVEMAVFAPWSDGGEIPEVHTCQGDDAPPTFTWGGVPDGTAELAIAMVDLDAEDPDGGGPFVHWLVTGIDPAVVAATSGGPLGAATEWPSSFGRIGWTGPCPPDGELHRYQVTLYALNQPVAPADGSPTADVVGLVESSSARSATIIGTTQG